MGDNELKESITELRLQVQRLSDKVDHLESIFKDVKIFSLKIIGVLISTGVIAGTTWFLMHYK